MNILLTSSSLCTLFEAKIIGFSDKYTQQICKLVELHDTPLTEQEVNQNPKSSYDRFIIQKFDALAHNPKKNQKRLQYIEKMESVFENIKIN